MTGLDVGPILDATADTRGIPLLLLLTCAQAESGLDPSAFRNGVWPDVSCGPFQQTVAFAGIGDHSDSPANIQLCRDAFADWGFAADTAGRSLQNGYEQAQAAKLSDDNAIMGALCCYNAGHLVQFGGWWWQSTQAASYRAALNWAKSQLTS